VAGFAVRDNDNPQLLRFRASRHEAIVPRQE
jgi:hypothetical protein